MGILENHLQHYWGIEKPKDKALVAQLFKKETLLRNEYLVRSGKNCDKFCFIESGMIRQFTELPDKEITQWIATKGLFITDLSGFMFRTKSRWDMQALQDCVLYSISHDDYIRINKLLPEWAELEKAFILKAAIIMENRIFSLISLSSEERYNLLFEQQRELFNQVPLQYLASMLGMTPETFSRIRAKKQR